MNKVVVLSIGNLVLYFIIKEKYSLYEDMMITV